MVWKKVGKVMRNVKILKSGKWRFLKGKYHARSSSRASRPRQTTKRRNTNMVKRKGHRKGGNLLGTVEKISKAGVLLAPTIRAALMPSDKLGHFILFNTGVNIRGGAYDWNQVKNSAVPIVGLFLGWKAFHKINGLIRRI